MIKKLAIIAALALLTSVSAKAQGFFNFSNYGAASGGNAPIKDAFGVLLNNTYKADYVWTAGAASGTGATVAFAGNGYFLGNKQIIDGQTGTVQLQVRVWNTADGSTYSAAAGKGGAQIGISDPISLTLATGNNQPPGMVTAGFKSFNLTVPEPSTIALGAMGLALLVFRRRK